MTKIILSKNTEDGKHHYSLVQFVDMYVIFKTTSRISADIPPEADFGEKMYENSDRDKAEEFFKNLNPKDSNL